LVLVRHAKSAWDDPTLADHDRPLAPRGRRALERLAAHLAALPIAPGLVLCSSARRTRETLAGVRSALPIDAVLAVDAGLYGASAQTMLHRLRRIDRTTQAAMVVGHNPGLQALAVLLAGQGDEESLGQLHRKFPTAAAATISFGGDWGDLGAGVGRLDDVFLPRRARA
jgi:phosphohistidine phosphatase